MLASCSGVHWRGLPSGHYEAPARNGYVYSRKRARLTCRRGPDSGVAVQDRPRQILGHQVRRGLPPFGFVHLDILVLDNILQLRVLYREMLEAA